MGKEIDKDTMTNRKRKNDARDDKSREDEELGSSSLPSLLTNRPVRRKLCFDNVTVSNAGNRTSTNSNNKAVVRPPCPFNVEVENLLNSTLEENRKQCIEKYNFDPVLEKPLEGKFKWEKL